MTCFTSEVIAFSMAEMATRPDTIRKWAAQDENQLLKKLAQQTIEAAKIGSAGVK